MPKRACTLATITVSALFGSAVADTLEMTQRPAVEPVSRGLSMSQVEKRYGEPSRRVDAVGDPPISRWVYPQFVVYFEGQHVIHAVATSPPG